MRFGDAESDGPERRCQVGGVERVLQRLRHHAFVDHVLDGEQPRDVGLGLFERAVGVLQLLPDGRLLAAHRDVVGPEAMHQLVDENVREERFERQIPLIAGAKDHLGNRLERLRELRVLDVLEHDALGSLFVHDALVVGQVERRGLNRAVAVARRIDLIDHHDRRQRAQLRVALLRIDRQVVLDVLQLSRESLQLRGLGLVEQGDVRLESGLVVEELVLVHLIRPDGRLNRAVQLHPRDVAVVVVVR